MVAPLFLFSCLAVKPCSRIHPRVTVAVDGAAGDEEKGLMKVEQKLELEQWDGGLACHWFATRDGAGGKWGWQATEPLKALLGPLKDH